MRPPAIYCRGIKVLETKSRASDARVEAVLEAVRTRLERYVARQYTTILRAVYGAVEALAEDGIPSTEEIYRIIASSDLAQRRALETMYRSMYDDASPLAIDDRALKLDGTRREVKMTQIEEERLRRWIEEHLGYNIRGIDSTTLRLIQRAAEESLDPEVFRQRIQALIQQAPYRAYRIARTETAGASNACMQMAAETYSFGRPMVKVWRTYGGQTVRPTHRQMDGVVVPSNELFRVPRSDGGVDLMEYPADQSHGASAANVVNCRCRVAYRYAD